MAKKVKPKLGKRTRRTTLWDLVRQPIKRKKNKPPARPAAKAVPAKKAPARRAPPAARPKGPSKLPPGLVAVVAVPPMTMAQRYEHITREMLGRYGVRVRKWRTTMSGVAWESRSRTGERLKLIESPQPRGPMSAAVFLHEIGHHALGLGFCSPRCLEEYYAWMFALEQMEALGLNITDAVHRRVHASLHYAIEKAKRRGLKEIPPQLLPYAARPPATIRARPSVPKKKHAATARSRTSRR